MGSGGNEFEKRDVVGMFAAKRRCANQGAPVVLVIQIKQ
jgi:hypothetical protein